MIFVCMILVVIVSGINIAIDKRMLAYGIGTFIASSFLLNTLISELGIKEIILILLIMALNFTLALISRNKIIGFESRMFSKINIIFLSLFYIIFCCFHNDFSDGIILGLIVNFMATGILYMLIKDILYAYIVVWIIYFFGREEIYNQVNVNITVYRFKGRNYSISISGFKYKFKASSAIARRYLREGNYTNIKRNIKVKRLPLFNFRLITEMW